MLHKIAYSNITLWQRADGSWFWGCCLPFFIWYLIKAIPKLNMED